MDRRHGGEGAFSSRAALLFVVALASFTVILVAAGASRLLPFVSQARSLALLALSPEGRQASNSPVAAPAPAGSSALASAGLAVAPGPMPTPGPPVVCRGDLARTANAEAAGLPQLTGARWKFRTGDFVLSSPALAGGTVYFGSHDAHLYALAAESGDLRWRFLTGAAVFSSPAVVENVVYFGSEDRHLYALR